MRILTNYQRFPRQWRLPSGAAGSASVATTYEEIVAGLDESDVLLIDGDLGLIFRLCLRFTMLPWKRKPLIAVDLVLGAPGPGIPRAVCAFKKLLLRRVDHFINYFKSSEGYARFYGITPERSTFIHFKSNIRHRHHIEPQYDGEYVLCFGRSRRDYDTFFDAIEKLPFPAAIPEPDFHQLNSHGSVFSRPLNQLPPTVTLLKDEKTQESQIRIVRGAKVVALPIVKASLLAGISVYLDAMLLGKCVVITEGAGITDVLTNEALFVPPGDADALARAIRRAWEDPDLRLQTAQRGYRHALSLGGEPEVYERILTALAAWMKSRPDRCT